MTVEELIERLRNYPSHYKVLAHNAMGIVDEAYIEDSYSEEYERIWITS